MSPLLCPALVLALLTGAAPTKKAPLLYVSNEQSNDITVIDTAADEVIATIPVGKRPRGLRISPDRQTLFVAVSGSPPAPPGVDASKLPPPDRSADGIAAIDLRKRKLLRVLESGTDPEAFDLSPDGKRIYVSNEDAAQVSVLDVASGKVIGRVKVGGEPEGVTTRPDGKVVYVTSEEEHRVDVIDARTHEVVARIPTGQRPRTVVFSRDGRRAFVSCENSAQVTIVDAVKHEVVGHIALPGMLARPMGLALSPNGKSLYVANGRGATVSFVDLASAKVRHNIEEVGVRPWGIALTPDGRKLYTANGPSNDVTVLDAKSGAVLKRISVGESPWGVAMSP